MVCSSCGAPNEAGRKFCGECGTRLVTPCPSCGAANPPIARFCGDCGSALSAGSPAPAAATSPIGASPSAALPRPAATPAPVAELRLVSILFADLVGFTTLAEGRDAEDTRELLSQYFDIAKAVIGRYGGTIEKFIGDAVMAVWGAPIAHEDDAERAVRAALELVDAVRALGPGIAARLGVLTGEAAVTIGATDQGLVAGDLVNTASRLQSAAVPGTVLVGEATQRAASAAIAFEPAGEQTLKGKASPVPAWRALRVVGGSGGRGRADIQEAPFVGRDDELRLLKDLYHATTRERRARLVSVIGPAGIGKTRLSWEFSKYTDGVVEAVWWHTGRSPAYGEGISFWALGEMVRGRARLAETDDEATTRSRIAATVAEHVPDETERRWIEPALLALLGVDAGRVPSDQLFAAWRTFFERLAATSPVVMVFEDFHHADSGLIDFVDHLLEWSRSFPIYVVTLSRPDLLEQRPAWGAGKRSFTSLFLEPLPAAAMGELLAGLVPGLPESAAWAIVARADGMPLYAVETVRMLLAEGRLVLDGGVYRPVGDLTTLAVPETLAALIASRLDALPPDERALVSDAAVLGQGFTPAGLAAVSGLDQAELAVRLRSLVSREILALDTDPRSPERGQYTFVQALIREVAYNGLAKRDRKARHLAAARFFETLGTDEFAGALAGHYLAAWRSAPEGPEADAAGAQARVALSAAADRAIALGSNEQALSFLEQALVVTTDAREQAELLDRAGVAAIDAGRYEVADAHLERALGVWRSIGDRAGAARATAGLGHSLVASGNSRGALAILEPAVVEFADLSGEPAGIALGGHLARAHYMNNEYRLAIEVADRVLETAEHADVLSVVADTLVTRGTALGILGRPIEGLGAIVAGRDLADVNGLGRTVIRAYSNLSFVEADRDPRAAHEVSRAGLAYARRVGIRQGVPVLVSNFADTGLRTGAWDAVLAEIREMLTQDWETADRMFVGHLEPVIRACRGEDVRAEVAVPELESEDARDAQVHALVDIVGGYVAFARGELEVARARWTRALTGDDAALPTIGPLAARASLWLGDPGGARAVLVPLDASGLHGPSVDAARLTMLAGLAAAEGRRADTLTLYREALRAWRDLGLLWDEALCGLDMAVLMVPADPDVLAAAERTREILVHLGAVPFIARLDAALARSATPA